MNLTKFDMILWRVNGILFLLGCLSLLASTSLAICGLLGLSHSAGQTLASRSSESKETGKKQPDENLVLNSFQPLKGTSLFECGLVTQGRGYASLSLSSSYSYAGNSYYSRNYLFYDSSNGHSFWLEPDNDLNFLSQVVLYDNPLASEDKKKVTGFIYETIPYIANDTRSFEERKKSISFYRLGGAIPKVVVDKVNKVLGIQQLNGDRVMISYVNDAGNFVMMIKAGTGEVIDTKQLPDMPT